MNNKEKAILLSGISSIFLLSGCSVDNNTKEEPVVIKEQTMEKVYSNLVKEFDAGMHIINYYDYIEESTNDLFPFDNEDGFVKTSIPSYEGYDLISVQAITEKCGYGSRTVGLLYVFVNNTPVEATGIYNYDKNVYEFYNPGTVVKEKVLK